MTTKQYDKLELTAMDDIDAAIWSGDLFHDRENITAFRQMMARWENGLKQAEAIINGADEIAKEIDRQVMASAGIHAGDGGYQLSTHEKAEEFAQSRKSKCDTCDCMYPCRTARSEARDAMR